MLKIKQMQIKAEIKSKVCNSLVEDLHGKYDFLIYGIKKNYVDKLSLSLKDEFAYIKEALFPKESLVSCGDIVFLKPGTIMYYKVKEESGIVELGIIGDDKKKDFSKLAKKIKKIIEKSLGEKIGDWGPVKKLDPSISVLLESAVSKTPSQEEIDAALELSDENVRDLIKTINQQDSIFQDSLMEQLKFDNIDEKIKEFENLGLVTTDFALLCSKTGQQILRVPDKSALLDISKKGFRCFLCGSSITDEKLVKAITISDFGKNILRSDYWFLLKTLYSLKNIGISYEDMFIISDESPDTKIFLNVNDESMMIQLVNRKLTLDDAYLINAHISAYKLKYLVVISTDELSSLMKSHLQETNADCEIDFIEKIDSLKEKLDIIMLEKEKNRIVDIIKEMSLLTPVPIEELILKKVVPGVSNGEGKESFKKNSSNSMSVFEEVDEVSNKNYFDESIEDDVISELISETENNGLDEDELMKIKQEALMDVKEI